MREDGEPPSMSLRTYPIIKNHAKLFLRFMKHKSLKILVETVSVKSMVVAEDVNFGWSVNSGASFSKHAKDAYNYCYSY